MDGPRECGIEPPGSTSHGVRFMKTILLQADRTELIVSLMEGEILV